GSSNTRHCGRVWSGWHRTCTSERTPSRWSPVARGTGSFMARPTPITRSSGWCGWCGGCWTRREMATVAGIVRTIATPRGPLLVKVERVADRWDARQLTPDDLLRAARALFREAALVSRQARRPEPEAATVGRAEG